MKQGILALFCALLIISLSYRPSEAGVPLLDIEGEGGGAFVPWAYLINPPKDGEVGKPALGAYIWVSSDYTFTFLNAAFSPHKKVELGISYETLDISELRSDLRRDSLIAVGAALDTGEDDLRMIALHAKFLLLEETDTAPAVAVSAVYKKSLDIDDVDKSLTRGVRSLLGQNEPSVLEYMGVDDDSGFDINLLATKLWKTELPVLTALNLRYTQANQTGFLGFSDDWNLEPEATLPRTR